MPPPSGSSGAQAGTKFKVVLLGEAGVGKSSLVLRLVKDEWVPNQHSTIGASFFRYAVRNDDGTSVNFDIWDTAGQERYKSLASMYYRGAAAAIVVYDITSQESFERAKYWIRELMSQSSSTIVALCGNKCDLEQQRKVSQEEAQRHAQEYETDVLFFETSAKTGNQVTSVFQQLAKKLSAAAVAAAESSGPRGAVNLNQQRQKDGKKKDGCSC